MSAQSSPSLFRPKLRESKDFPILNLFYLKTTQETSSNSQSQIFSNSIFNFAQIRNIDLEYIFAYTNFTGPRHRGT